MKIKVLALLTASVLTLGLFTGCTKEDSKEDSAGGSQSSSEPMEITIAHWDVEEGLAGGEEDLVLKTIQDKFNVKFVPLNITWDDYKQKIQLWAASGSLPDIFSIDAIGTSFYYDWIDQGVIKGLPKDLSDYPNLEEYLDVDDIQAMKIEDQLYAIPRKTYPNITWTAIDRTVSYRWDLAQKAGVTKEPETWEEFSDMMLKIIEADPEGKNISGMTTTQTSLLDGFLFTHSLPGAMSDGSGNDYKWVEKDGQYVPAYFAGDGLATFENARELYETGVIEKDIALAKLQQSEDKFLQGQSAAILRASGPEAIYGTVGKHWEELHPGQDVLEDVKVLKLLPSEDGNKYYPAFRTSWSESYISGKVSDEKLEKILEVYDFLVSEEGINLINYGIEGVDYDVVDNKVVLKDDGVMPQEKYPFIKRLSALAAWSPAVWDETKPSNTPEGYRELSVKKYTEAITDGTPVKFDMRYTYLSTPLKDEFTIFPAEDLLNIMMGTEPVEKMYNDLMASYEEKGLTAMIEEVNKVAKEKGFN